MSEHPLADSVLTGQEQDDQHQHQRELDDARPLHPGDVKAPAAHPVAAGAEARESSGDRPPPKVTGGLAQMAAAELRSALNHLGAARVLMDEGEGLRLPSAAFARVSYAREAADSAVRYVESAVNDVEKGRWP